MEKFVCTTWGNSHEVSYVDEWSKYMYLLQSVMYIFKVAWWNVKETSHFEVI